MSKRKSSIGTVEIRLVKTFYSRGFLLFLAFFLTSCSTIIEMPKYGFSEGFYKGRVSQDGKKQWVYVDMKQDSLAVYQVNKVDGKKVVDLSSRIARHFPEERDHAHLQTLSFSRHTFDLDLITIPVKYRFTEGDIPPQVNSAFGASIYLGYRGDDFMIHYKENPIGTFNKKTNHFGHSFGLFAGFTSADMRSEYTNGHVIKRYTGFALTTGGAFLIGINNFTVGFAIGIDYLLDKNKSHWIYQNKPWVGLSVGLGLN